MIRLSELINEYGAALQREFKAQLLPSHQQALKVMQTCRTDDSPMMQTQCLQCLKQALYPHSCGHRSCPHCQHHECEQWLTRQRAKRLPVDYYMVTFTLPAQLRAIAWQHQRLIYNLMFQLSWETLQTFGLNDKQLQGKLGATSVLHTNTRSLDYHPHVHMVIPAGALHTQQRLWRNKKGKYLFNQKNLAQVFRAKVITALTALGIRVTETLPDDWIVDCKRVGKGNEAITYLGKYLYRGVLMEKNIISNRHGQVTFRYVDNKGEPKTRSLPGAAFLWLLLKHVLPQGFRRAREYGLLHPNSKQSIRLLQLILNYVAPPETKRKKPDIICQFCGGIMRILAVKQYKKLMAHAGECAT